MNRRGPRKLLLDEMMPQDNRHDFSDYYTVSTVDLQEWKGRVNGNLQATAAAAGFEALITMDKTMRHHARNPPFPVLVIQGCELKIAEVRKRVPAIMRLLATAPANAYHDVWM